MNDRHMKNGRGIRHRSKGSNISYLPEFHGVSQRDRKYLLPTPTSHLLTLLCFLVALSVTIIVLEKKLPTPLLLKDAHNHPGQFIAERAMYNLIKLTGLGPRPTGSYENEVLAVKFFVKEISEIMQNAQKVHRIIMDIQKPSGAFPLTFLDGMTNVYRNVQNVVVKIGPHSDTGHSLLINCHFDTVSDSPGGSDDGASCAIMLEILKVISQTVTPLKHNIILLFNGAEENLMQASHGFITQHEWAKEVRSFINLEACGAGGKEILFQAGPNHPWIMETYSAVVPYPYASSLAQEIFQSGIIPGDTDFRIFRDFGNISGLDFAWSTNGYVYHTKFDNVEQIPLGTLQRTGDNILALALGMANGKELSNVQMYSAGNIVFFDFLGAYVFRWSEFLSLLINLSLVMLSVYSVVKNMRAGISSGLKREVYLKQLGLSCGVVLLTWIFTPLISLMIAFALTVLDRTMSWYSQPAWIFFLYICPTLLVPMATVWIASQRQKAVVRSVWSLFQIYYDSYQLVWTGILIFCTLMKVRSGFIAVLWTVFPSVGSLLRSTLFSHWRDWKWLVLHGSILILPFAQCIYLIFGAMNLYIPIMGRVGAGNNPEVIVAVITSLMFLLLFSFLTPLILLVRNPQRILSVLIGLFLAAMGVLILTPLGFPYSGDPAAPSPQRFMMAHTQRVYHDEYGRVRERQTGYWIVDMDQNSPGSVKSLVREMQYARPVDSDCSQELYCGLPYLMPVLTFIWKTHWIPGPAPNIPVPTTLDLISTQYHDGLVRRMTFSITGPDHIGVMISPYSGVTLIGWSLVPGDPLQGPKWNGRDTYFIYYSCASDPKPWVFWIDLKGNSGVNQSIDIAVTSHFIHGQHQRNDQFSQFLAEFPQWTSLTAWTATYSSWKF
ncbi:endoplasmic reticulum metallopeptidase 1 [Anabrus simplex]|uniref:endoplasmic reticulum metallopeptidase 1 n=1 Tax=Anabrus simplex TaxID=316456 RepID=UPI0035A2A5BC